MSAAADAPAALAAVDAWVAASAAVDSDDTGAVADMATAIDALLDASPLRRDIVERGIPAAKLTVIPNAVDVEGFQLSGALLHRVLFCFREAGRFLRVLFSTGFLAHGKLLFCEISGFGILT